MFLMTQPKQVVEFIRLFNDGRHFEAHEVLELLWRQDNCPDRKFYQALIQIAAVFVHLKNHNIKGALILFGKAENNFRDFCPAWAGLNIEKLLADVRACIEDNRTLYSIDWNTACLSRGM